jgi:hypothetical protein
MSWPIDILHLYLWADLAIMTSLAAYTALRNQRVLYDGGSSPRLVDHVGSRDESGVNEPRIWSSSIQCDCMFTMPQGFYDYLFVVSIVFLVYVQFFIVQTNDTLYSRLRRRVVSIWSTCYRCCRRQSSPSSNEECGNDAGDNSSKQSRRQMSSFGSHVHTGSFYLRLGAVGECLFLDTFVSFPTLHVDCRTEMSSAALSFAQTRNSLVLPIDIYIYISNSYIYIYGSSIVRI